MRAESTSGRMTRQRGEAHRHWPLLCLSLRLRLRLRHSPHPSTSTSSAMPLNPKVRITETGVHGHCWFAGEDFKAGEWIWKKREEGAPHTDIYLTYEQIAALPEEKRTKWLSLAYQVDSNLMCGFDPEREPIYEELIEDYVNHSCNGNSWYEGDDLLVAMRDIKAGEEIYYDYALTENHPDFSFPKCMCGAANCRGRITGNDWMIPELQEKYGRHFLPHVLRSIDDLKEKQAKEEAAAAAAAGSASSPAASAEAATAAQ